MVSLSLKWMVVDRRCMIVSVIKWVRVGGITRLLPFIISSQLGQSGLHAQLQSINLSIKYNQTSAYYRATTHREKVVTRRFHHFPLHL